MWLRTHCEKRIERIWQPEVQMQGMWLWRGVSNVSKKRRIQRNGRQGGPRTQFVKGACQNLWHQSPKGILSKFMIGKDE